MAPIGFEPRMIRSRVMAGLARARANGKRRGRRLVRPSVEAKIRDHLAAGTGSVKTARTLGVGVSTVQRVRATLPAAAGTEPQLWAALLQRIARGQRRTWFNLQNEQPIGSYGSPL